MSSIVTDLLEATMPSLERLEVLLEHANSAPSMLLRDLERSMQDVGDELASKALDARQMDLLPDTSPAPAREAEAPRRAAARAGLSSRSKSARPPATNRGVRIPPETNKFASISPMKTKKKATGEKK